METWNKTKAHKWKLIRQLDVKRNIVVQMYRLWNLDA